VQIGVAYDAEDVAAFRIGEQTVGGDEQGADVEVYRLDAEGCAAAADERLALLALGEIDDIGGAHEPRAGIADAGARDRAGTDREDDRGALAPAQALEIAIEVREQGTPVMRRGCGCTHGIDDGLGRSCAVGGATGAIGESDDDITVGVEDSRAILAEAARGSDRDRVRDPGQVHGHRHPRIGPSAVANVALRLALVAPVCACCRRASGDGECQNKQRVAVARAIVARQARRTGAGELQTALPPTTVPADRCQTHLRMPAPARRHAHGIEEPRT
jgi:hypothetical protein